MQQLPWTEPGTHGERVAYTDMAAVFECYDTILFFKKQEGLLKYIKIKCLQEVQKQKKKRRERKQITRLEAKGTYEGQSFA